MIQQSVLVVEDYYQNCERFVATIRKMRSIFGRNIVPNVLTVDEGPKTSTRHRAQELDVSTLHHLLTKDLHLHVYKMKLSQ